MKRTFVAKSGAYKLEADDTSGEWVLSDGRREPSIYTAKDGESFVVNRIFTEEKAVE